jgi:alpha-L-fucosidase
VTTLGVPEEDVVVKALGTKTAQNKRKIKSVTLLGSDEKLTWTQAQDELSIKKPASVPSPEALVFKVVFK